MLASRVSNASCPWTRGEYAGWMRFQFHGLWDEDRTWYEYCSTGNSGRVKRTESEIGLRCSLPPGKCRVREGWMEHDGFQHLSFINCELTLTAFRDIFTLERLSWK